LARLVVEVMLKPEIHDPQGEAIASACHRLGFGEVTAVRQGKRFEVELAEPAGTGPASTGPAGTGPAGTGPAGTEPASTEPAGTGPSASASGAAAAARVAEIAAELLANPVIEEFTIRPA
jgi:phosphoribosylformylglycinamidine (FGAM) synthase PurS component